MIEVKIPDFLKYVPDKSECKLSMLMREYNEKIGGDWGTEGFDFSDEELEKILEQCLHQNRTFYDVIGVEVDIVEDEDI